MKYLTKTTLCGIYKYSGVMLAQEALGRAGSWPYLSILLFHRVTDAIPPDGLTVSTERFRAICHMLQRGFHVVPLVDAFRLARTGVPLPPRTVAITFDDCYRDNLFAAEVLAEHGLPACFFIPTGFVDTDLVFDWDRNLPRMPNLTWQDVRALHPTRNDKSARHATGLFHVGRTPSISLIIERKILCLRAEIHYNGKEGAVCPSCSALAHPDWPDTALTGVSARCKPSTNACTTSCMDGVGTAAWRRPAMPKKRRFAGQYYPLERICS
jgi:hypothetical protein